MCPFGDADIFRAQQPKERAFSQPMRPSLSVKAASELLGVSIPTLRRWDRTGILRAHRNPVSNYRVYDEAELRAWMSQQHHEPSIESKLLRTQGDSLFGREDTLSELHAKRAAGHSLIVLVGPPGVGKTRALQTWLSALPDEEVACNVVAGPCRSAEDLTTVILSGIELPVRARSPEARIVDMLDWFRDKRFQVVALDEIENLDDDAQSLIGQIAATGVRVVATSRVRPRIADVTLLPLVALSYPSEHETLPVEAAKESAAAQLFIAHAQKRGALKVLDDEVWFYAGVIARRLEGLPLALTLAASRTLELGVARLAEELAHSLDAITIDVDVPLQQRTLQATVATSLDRLEPLPLALLEVATVLPDGFSLEELEALAGTQVRESQEGRCAPPGSLQGVHLPPHLRVLLDHSIVTAHQREGAAATLSFAIHTLVREVTRSRISPLRKLALEEQHAVFRAGQARILADDRTPRAVLRVARAARAFRQAFEWTELHPTHPDAASMGAELASALGRLIESHGPSDGLTSLLDRAAACANTHAVSPARRAEIEFYRGFARVETWDLVGARKQLEYARTLASGGVHPRIEANAWAQLAWVAAREGRALDADQIRDAMAELTTKLDDPRLEMVVTGLQAVLDINRARFARARQGVERWRIRAVGVGDATHEAFAIGSLGCLALEEHGPSETLPHFDRAIQVATRMHSPTADAIFRGYRAMALHQLHDAGADEAYQDAIARAERAHSLVFAALFRGWHAVLRAQQGRTEEASRTLDLMSAFADWDVSHTLLSLMRGHIDLAEAREARANGNAAGEARSLATAARRLSLVDEAQRLGIRELRVVLDYLARALREALPEAPPKARGLVIGWQGAFLRIDGVETSLERHRTLRRLVWELALRRLTDPASRASVESLVKATWPGEALDASTGAHRLRVAMSTLRGFGLQALLEHEKDGYRLDPAGNLLIVKDR